ncbi:estradiol 17-beta-dehydrogenase 2-like isoform X1 [Hemicordylus capensis]|uniref:estradiol 17-beta-dehydrogenase 2-like isoform X1 n=1 Tax=Hemicordylus capensis TaxID=884348 RepID=UPI0023026D90|nr:estradiol 17-beta-dehydrogenase 2-like isoform X1 [Hemicordylus capensis]
MIGFHELILLAADLTLASAFSCFLYGLACFCLASLTGFVIFLSAFGEAKKMKRKIDQKGRAIMIVVSNSSVGQMFVKTLDKAGFGVLAVCRFPEGEWAPVVKKDCSSNVTVTQLPVAEETYQKAMKTLIENDLCLKGLSGEMKKPSIMIWDEEAETQKICERKVTPKQKKCCVTPAFLIALLCVPTKTVCLCLKKRGRQLLTPLQTALFKYQDLQHLWQVYMLRREPQKNTPTCQPIGSTQQPRQIPPNWMS